MSGSWKQLSATEKIFPHMSVGKKSNNKNPVISLPSCLLWETGSIIGSCWLLTWLLPERHTVHSSFVDLRKNQKNSGDTKALKACSPREWEKMLMLWFQRKELAQAHNGYQTGSGRTVFSPLRPCCDLQGCSSDNPAFLNPRWGGGWELSLAPGSEEVTFLFLLWL